MTPVVRSAYNEIRAKLYAASESGASTSASTSTSSGVSAVADTHGVHVEGAENAIVRDVLARTLSASEEYFGDAGDNVSIVALAWLWR